MIGIKVQNLVWEKALLNLLGDEAEKYRKNCTYTVVISESPDSDNCPNLILGKDIPLPFCFNLLKDKLKLFQAPHFENNLFKWIPQTRQLIYKTNQKIIQLTEKESDIIGFLAQQPQHKATKEEILKSVWHYQDDIHTHTLESHIYSLRQKLTPDGEQFITVCNGVYELIL